MCPEPGCEYVAKRREEIQAHMSADHVEHEILSSSAVSLRLFMCPFCNSHLELKGKEDFRRHLDHCKNGITTENTELDFIPGPSESFSLPSLKSRTSSITKYSFKCISCNFKFSTLSEFDQHVIQSGDPATCEVAPDVDGDVTDDVFKLPQVERLKCDRCDFAFTAISDEPNRRCSQRQMTKHYKEEHGVQNLWLCGRPGCDFRSECPKLIRRHKEEEMGKTQCEVCGVQVNASYLSTHMKVHTDVTHDCEHCSRPYSNGHALK